jgi:hypothetical protein
MSLALGMSWHAAECGASETLESEICSSHIAARGGAGPWRAQRLVDRVCLQVGG